MNRLKELVVSLVKLQDRGSERGRRRRSRNKVGAEEEGRREAAGGNRLRWNLREKGKRDECRQCRTMGTLSTVHSRGREQWAGEKGEEEEVVDCRRQLVSLDNTPRVPPSLPLQI